MQGVGLTLDDCMGSTLLETLSRVNFNDFVTFIKQLDTLLRQMGTLLLGVLPSLVNVLVHGVIKLSKLFIKRVNEIKLQHQAEPIELNEEASEDDEEEAGTVHRNAGRQAKECLRKALGLVKDISRKFSYDKVFIAEFSEVVFREIIKDQLPHLKQRYVSDKS